MLVATVKCSPSGLVKNEQSVAPSTAGSAPMSSSGQIDMRALVDRQQGRGHRHVDILALPGRLAAVQRRQDGDRRLSPA